MIFDAAVESCSFLNDESFESISLLLFLGTLVELRVPDAPPALVGEAIVDTPN